MAKSRVNINQMEQMIRDDERVVDIAKRFNVSPGRISQIKKEIRRGVVKVEVMERARELVTKDESIIGDFRRMIGRIETQLESLEQDLGGMKAGEEKRLNIDSLVKCISEQRKLNSSLTDIVSTWHDHILLNEFKQALVEVFETYDADVQKKIRAAIEKRGVIPAILRSP